MPEANKNSSYRTRYEESRWVTNHLIGILAARNHFHDVKPATTEQDKQGLDYWCQFESGGLWIPNQFKLRVAGKDGQRDCPVVFRQPFFGCDVGYSNKSNVGLNKLGRDYVAIVNGKNKLYYVAVKNANTGLYDEIYIIRTVILKKIITRLESEWINQTQFDTCEGLEVRNPFYTYSEGKLTRERLNQTGNINAVAYSNDEGQVWLQKVGNERFHKINCYVKESLKEKSFKIDQRDAEILNREFLSWRKER
jgi:hypothetical protein